MPRTLAASLAALFAAVVAAPAPAATGSAWRTVTFDHAVRAADRGSIDRAGGVAVQPSGARSYVAFLSADGARSLAGRAQVRRVRVADKVAAGLEPGAQIASVVRVAGGRRVSEYVRLDAARTPTAIARRADVLHVGTAPVRLVPEDEGSSQLQAGNHAAGVPKPGYASWLDGVGLNGAGVRIAVVDTGIDVTHPDLDDRVVSSVNYEPVTGPVDADEQGHGTHVAGIVAGAPDVEGQTAFTDLEGFQYGLGVAPGAELVAQNGISLVAPDLVPLIPVLTRDATREGAVAWNASWHTGEGAGSGYIETVRIVDGLVRDADPEKPGAQPFTMVFSAGNEGDGEKTITVPKEAKNIITVGATKGQRATGTTEEMASFSSRGPGRDGRILPTVTAPGETISSARSKPAGGLCFEPPSDGATPIHSLCSGTSMAAPHVAGAVALLTQWWRGFNAGATPSPAMTKALLVNSATDLDERDVPNFDEGWGRVNVGTLFATPPAARVHADQTQLLSEPGELRTIRVAPLDPTKPIRATLVWTDVPGVAATTDEQKEKPALVNDLDLSVKAGDGTAYLGNVFTEGRSVPGGGPDRLNNVENVWVDAAGAGVYEITVRAQALPGDGVPTAGDTTDQDYALAIANATLLPPVAAPAPVVVPVAAKTVRLTISTRSAKLRRLKGRRLPVLLRTTAPLTRVEVVVRKGTRIVARGRLAALPKTGKVLVRLGKRFAPGRYTVSASGVTAAKTTVVAKRTLRIAR